MKVALCFLCVAAMASAESWVAAPYTLVKRGDETLTLLNILSDKTCKCKCNNDKYSCDAGASTRASEEQPPGQQQKRQHQHEERVILYCKKCARKKAY